MDSRVDEAIAWIQRITVKRLSLDVKPAELCPDLEFTDLEVIRDGRAERLDSMDLVNVIAVLEDAFEKLDDTFEEDLVVEFRKWLGKRDEEKNFTIQNMATFLVEQFNLDPRRVRKLDRSTK